MEIIWADPPADGRTDENRRWQPPEDPRRLAMRENPGRWLLWASTVTSSNVTILRKTGGKRGFEFVSRNGRIENNRRVCDIYGRFLGPNV